MALPVIRVDPELDGRWLTLVERSPQSLVFHHPAWLRLLREQYGYRSLALLALDADGAPAAGVPVCRVTSRLTGKRLVSLPFSDLCPLLLAEGAPESCLEAVGASLLEMPVRESLPLEIRGAVPGAPPEALGARFLHHLLDLTPGGDAVLADAHKQIRRGVSKAARSGVEVARRTDRDGLDRFYALHVETRRRQGVPVQPRSFIRRLEALFSEGLGHVLLAEHGGATAAAAVFVGYGRTLTYKYGASDTAHLDVRPNNAIFAEAIRWAAEQGYDRLDFGRTDRENTGLAAFKRNWGAEEHEIAYTRLPPSPGARDETPGAARRLASTVIRRSPPIVGRAVGAALYRHFG